MVTKPGCDSGVAHIVRIAVALVAAAALLAAANTAAQGPDHGVLKRPTPDQQATGNLNDDLALVGQFLPDFGGLYYDDEGNLTVYLLEPDPQREREVRDVLTRVFGDEILTRSDNERRPVRRVEVELVEGRFDIRQLLQWFDEIQRVLDTEGVWFVELDEMANRLTIGIERTEIIEHVERELRSLRVPREAVVFEETEPIVLGSHTLRSHVRPAVGGIQIRYDGSICTMGFNATFFWLRGFVTNSHCSAVQGTVTGTQYFNHITGTGHLLGQELIDPSYWDCKSWFLAPTRACRWSDSAFVLYQGGVSNSLGRIARTTGWAAPGQGSGSISISHANPTMQIVANAWPPYPFKNEMVDKVGRTTGWTYGFVNKTCANTNVAATVGGKTVRLLCQDRANYTVSPGDSGSPVFLWYGDTVHLLGINWGGADGWFSALWNIWSDLGSVGTH